MTKQPKKLTKRRAMTPEDLLRFRIVSDPQIAPDGSRVVFVEKHVGERNEYTANLWMVVVAGNGLPCQFTAGGKDHTPRWSPDGKQIAFLRKVGQQVQIYLIDARGGEARELSHFPEGSIGSFRWSPDGRRLAVSFRPQDLQGTEEARRDRQERGLSDPPIVIDDLWYRLDGDGYFGRRRPGPTRLHLVEACDEDARIACCMARTRWENSVSTSRPTRGGWSWQPIATQSRRFTPRRTNCCGSMRRPAELCGFGACRRGPRRRSAGRPTGGRSPTPAASAATRSTARKTRNCSYATL